jgi:hypothetical protein
LQNAALGGCLGQDGFLHLCDSSPAESWYITRWADGTIRFQNQASGKCIADGQPRPGDISPWANCNSSQQQSW